jgi:hypothetical protein
MEIIADRESDLKLSWNPATIWKGGSTYTSVIIGRMGPGGKVPWKDPSLPNSLNFIIQFKNRDDIPLYQAISEMLDKLKTVDDEILISGTNRTPNSFLVREKRNLKENYQTKATEIKRENDLLRNQISILVKQLEHLGCDCDDLRGPLYQTIPDDWYEWNEYIDVTKASISVCCHDQTKFYQYLRECGILDKYFPEWYRIGAF